MKTQIITLSFFACCLFAACKKKDENNQQTDGFDRKAMLGNIGSNVIIPSFQALQTNATNLDGLIADFNAGPTAAKLIAAQNGLKALYLSWQSCSAIEIGKANDLLLDLNSNTFPTDTTKINANITTGSYNLAAAINVPAKGLPALDYLLFGADNATVLGWYTTDSKAANRKQYLAAVSAELKTNANAVANDWNISGGNYLQTFINADGTDVGSSTGMLINKLDYDIDVFKNAKLGIPLGKESMGQLLPGKVEAYYSGISSQLAVAQLQAYQNIYLGKGVQGDGVGLDDYLAKINASYHGGMLNDTIKYQFTVAIAKMQAVSDPLSLAVQNNTAAVNAAYVEAQKLLVLLKTDMPSALGVLITYVDNDGD